MMVCNSVDACSEVEVRSLSRHQCSVCFRLPELTKSMPFANPQLPLATFLNQAIEGSCWSQQAIPRRLALLRRDAGWICVIVAKVNWSQPNSSCCVGDVEQRGGFSKLGLSIHLFLACKEVAVECVDVGACELSEWVFGAQFYVLRWCCHGFPHWVWILVGLLFSPLHIPFSECASPMLILWHFGGIIYALVDWLLTHPSPTRRLLVEPHSW